jgi:hypothetical protein
MDRDYWTRSIRKWFQPYHPDGNENVAKQYYAGAKKSKSREDEGLRSIRVWIGARRPRHFEEEFLHSFYGKILVLGDEDNLVLLDETRAPILIPWFTIRFVEVD